VQEERVVAKDTTVLDHRQRLQIPQDPHRFPDVKVTVRVHEYPDGTLAVCPGPRYLAAYYADGRLIETGRAHTARTGPTHGSNVLLIVDPRPHGARHHFGARLTYAKRRTGPILCYINQTS
jgi:hypothetical protein